KINNSLGKYRLFASNELKKENTIKKQSSKNSRSWLSCGGISIAFVGADGSGKSTMVANLTKWLENKLSANSFYMGIPKNNKILIVLRLILRISSKLKFQILINHVNVFYWTYVAKLRYLNYLRAEMLKNRGEIVLFDRYPIKEFWNTAEPMDGPRLMEYPKKKMNEFHYYNAINNPDYIFVLKVKENEAIARKEKQNIYQNPKLIRKKICIIENFANLKNDRIIVIDTSKNQEETLLKIKKKIWEII
ncbi:MAG: hypothetical protein ACTSPQ_13755, partial [Candidatus Helarchaeota archaeon]